MTNDVDRVTPRLCLVAALPSTLWVFYRRLITALPAKGFQVGLACSDAPGIELLRTLPSARIHPLEIRRAITPWQDVRTTAALAGILRHHAYSIVHGHTPKGGLLAMLAATMAGVRRRLYTLHGLPLETETGVRRALLATTERVSCHLARHVLAVSPSLRACVQDLRLCPPHKLQILGKGTACGIDLEQFTRTPEVLSAARARRQQAGIPEDALVIGFVGRLVPDKGAHVLLHSFLRLSPRWPHSYLLVIGDFEPHRGSLDPVTVQHLNTHPRIRRVAFTNQMASYYAAMDLLVLPTRREGFPYSLLEAAAMQLPVVATRVTGCVDAVMHGQNGFLTAPEDAQDVAAAVERLLADPDLRRSFGQAGRNLVVQNFAVDHLVHEHLQLYRQVLKENGIPARSASKPEFGCR